MTKELLEVGKVYTFDSAGVYFALEVPFEAEVIEATLDENGITEYIIKPFNASYEQFVTHSSIEVDLVTADEVED